MKTIIIAEKPIAGQNIAKILSNNNFSTKKLGKDPAFYFNHDNFGETILIPLKGHISDVDFPSEFSNWYKTNLKDLATKVEVLYKEKEKNIIKMLKNEGKTADLLIIATDADREGESIGREAIKYIREVNPNIKIKRAYFSAITKDEITKAFNDLKEINYNLADAADSRREIDLIWGAVLTRFLSLATRSTGKNFLSVGRVQSPTLTKIVERQEQIDNFKPTPYWEIEITCEKNKEKFKAKYKKGRFLKKEDAEQVFNTITNKAKIIKVTKKEKKIPKPIPFNTTDFLRVAANLGFDAMKAMEIAEKLYMEGYISYPRTDNQSYKGINIKKILDDINKGHLKNNVEKILKLEKIIPSKGKETKDHPPIHPVSYLNEKKATKEELKIYNLIVDRFLATLAEDAISFNTNVDLENNSHIFTTKGVIIKKMGWMEFYKYNKIKEEKLPELNENEIVDIKDKKLLSKQTKPPAYYSQSTLIKLMEDLNLGTKSTRPSIITKLYARKYISGKKQIKANELAKKVVNLLKKYAKEVTEPEMTAKLEKEMNNIEEGKITKEQVVKESREMLEEIVKELEENKQNIAKEIKSINQEPFGICPNCGKPLRKMKSKKGKWFVSCSGFPECKTTFPLPQKNEFIFANKHCEICKAPIIKVKTKNGEFEMCINPNCPSNKEWQQKKKN